MLFAPEETLEAVAQRELKEVARRERLYGRGRTLPDLRDRIVIITDDGVATGSSMLLAARAIRRLGAGFVVVAVPVAPPGAIAQLEQVANHVVCLAAPEEFSAVGEWYQDFHQLDDREVCQILDRRLERASEAQCA